MAYKNCKLCPRQCKVDRTAGETGFCGCPDVAMVAKTMLHLWEEPVLTGGGASGAIFGGDKTVAEINALAKAGARLTDKGFMSTSASEGAQFSGRYRFVITIPAGTGRGAYVAPVSHYGSENEFLLQRNSTFKIVKAVDAGRVIDVHLRLEPPKKKKKN